MIRAAREQPRLVVAKTLGLLGLLVCGVAFGALLGGDSGADARDDAARTTQLRLVGTERALRSEGDLLRTTRARLDRSRTARARTAARLRTAQRTSVKLRRDLRRVRRALIRARERQ